MSNLVASDGSAGAGGARVYVNDASGQRVAKVQVSELATQATAVAVSVYAGDVQVDDANATATGHVADAMGASERWARRAKRRAQVVGARSLHRASYLVSTCQTSVVDLFHGGPGGGDRGDSS